MSRPTGEENESGEISSDTGEVNPISQTTEWAQWQTDFSDFVLDADDFVFNAPDEPLKEFKSESESASGEGSTSEEGSGSTSEEESEQGSVSLEGEEHLLKHFDTREDVQEVVDILAGALPSDFLNGTKFTIDAMEDEIQFKLDYGTDPLKKLEFKFTINDEGKDLHIDLAKLGPDLQGQGLMKPMLKGILDIATTKLSPKLEKISLLANIDVGGYAWARYGFEPDDPAKVVGELKQSILDVLQSKTIQLDGFDRTIEIPPDIEKKFKDLHAVDQTDPRKAFQLLANATTKVKVPGKTLTLGVERLPGGTKVRDCCKEIKFWQQKVQEGDPRAQGELDDVLQGIPSAVGALLMSLMNLRGGGTVPGTKYVPDANGLQAINSAIDILEDATLDNQTMADRIGQFSLSVTAPDVDPPLSLSQVLMLGSNWDGHVSMKKDDPDGLERLKGYVKPKSSGEKS